MSSHVVVIDSTARRAVVKTTPSKPLADILQEASAKLGFDPNNHGLKHQSKTLDLSLSIRLAGLSSGAKLELVQLSRSPAVVTVALQLPESEAQGIPNGRLLDKFPSTTTLWLVLRKFEAGVAGGTQKRNLTARGAPATDSGDSGAGRLYYQTPVIQVMGRELSSFTELQKSLAQLGFNSGNVLLRLSFKTTEEPLEEAMAKITQYFTPFDEQTAAPSGNIAADEPTSSTSAPPPTTKSTSEDLTTTPTHTQAPPPATPATPLLDDPGYTSAATTATTTATTTAATSVASRPVTIYRPPTATTPQSAQTAFREEDYVPSIEHAKSHQERLNQASRNTRLLSDAEIAAKAAAEEERLSQVKQVDVKIRFPEQSQILAQFGPSDTAATLYSFARDCLHESIAHEKFILTVPGIAPRSGGGLKTPSSQSSTTTTIPDSSDILLIKDLGLRGRVLVNFSWDDTASVTARGSTSANLLKTALRSQAQDITVPEIPQATADDQEEKKSSSTFGKLGAALKRGNDDGDGKKGGGMPKWFKVPGKK